MPINKGYLTCGTNAESDEVLTPRYAVEPIIKYLKFNFFKNILCPFDKDNSKYVEVLRKNGFNVINSHLETKDFFDYKIEELSKIDCIVSNPPFSLKDKILERLYEVNRPFMMLLPQNSLQSCKRTKLFMKYGIEYLGFDSRVCFYTKGELDKIKVGNHFASGYFCNRVLPEKLIFEELKLVQESY